MGQAIDRTAARRWARRRWWGGAGLAVVALVVAACSPPLDPGFGGGDGIITIAGSTASPDQPAAVVVQPDGKIVVLFSEQLGSGYLIIERFNPDGSPDTSFGTGGRVETGQIGFARNDLELQPDGKYLVSTSVIPNPQTSGVGEIVRYNADGTLDTSFGSGGHTSVDATGALGDIQLQPDGKVLAVLNSQQGLRVARWLPDGTLDTGFGVDGVAELQVSHELYRQWANAVAVQADGKIVVAGGAATYTYGVPPEGMALVRFNADGTPDATFAGQGGLVARLGGWAEDVAVRPSGQILVTGTVEPRYSGAGTAQMYLAQYTTAGAPDSGFGTRGVVRAVDDGHASAMTLTGNGKVVVVGREWLPDWEPDGHDGFISVRYNQNGTLDASYGAGGVGTTDHFPGDADEHAYEVAVQRDGKLVVVGTVPSQADEQGTDVGVYRYDAG